MSEASAVHLRTGTVPLALPNAESTASNILAKAMDFCAKKMGLADAQVARQRLIQGDHTLCQYCQYSLALQVAEALGALDQDCKAVYLFNCDDSPDILCLGEVPPLTPLHMLAWVAQKTDFLQELAQGLDRALAQALADTIGRSPTAHILDLQVIDDQDVETRRGYGALLSSMYSQPLKLWAR